MPDTLWYGFLPDGMRDLTSDGMGGLYISGFDSRLRVCLILFAPSYGQRLRTVSMLPYRDYGRYTPTVLTAMDPLRERNLYILLYLHPDNLGISQTSLFRLDLNNGARQLLSEMTSPFWVPTAILPRKDGSVIISLSGLGPLLIFCNCNATTCDPATTLTGEASEAVGKAGLAQLGGLSGGSGSLCMVVGSSPLTSTRTAVVCQAPALPLHTPYSNKGILSHELHAWSRHDLLCFTCSSVSDGYDKLWHVVDVTIASHLYNKHPPVDHVTTIASCTFRTCNRRATAR